MNRKWLFIIVGIIIFLLLFAAFFSIRTRISQTEEILGPVYENLGTVQRIRIALRCSDVLDRFTESVNP